MPKIGHSQALDHRFDGTAWNRTHNNWNNILLPSAARAASVNSVQQINYSHVHVLLFLDITVRTAAETIQLALDLQDPISGGYATVWTAAAAVGAVGLYTYLLGPAGVAAVYTENVHIVLPRLWRVAVTQVAAGPITYSVAAAYLGH